MRKYIPFLLFFGFAGCASLSDPETQDAIVGGAGVVGGFLGPLLGVPNILPDLVTTILVLFGLKKGGGALVDKMKKSEKGKFLG